MSEFEIGWQRVVDGQGLPIAVAGMTIVFTALSLITGFIALLPRILARVARRFPETDGHPAPRRPAAPAEPDLAAVAAAGCAFHAHARRA